MGGQICLLLIVDLVFQEMLHQVVRQELLCLGRVEHLNVCLELSHHQMLQVHIVFLYDGDWTQVIQSQQCHILHKRGKE